MTQSWVTFLCLICLCGNAGTVGGDKDGRALPIPLPTVAPGVGDIVTPEAETQDQNESILSSGTELTPDPVGSLLLVSTLDGSLTALDRHTGQRRWISKGDPMIRVPPGAKLDSLPKAPFFLPDPRSGSLYLLGRHGQLKKLPFSIPKLVSMAPCRSSEGLYYSGRKLDTWINLNLLTGEKTEVRENDDLTCPLAFDRDGNNPLKTKTVVIGKSQYTISMQDGFRKWNVTFQDYASVNVNPQTLEEHDLHFTSPSTGTILTYERDSGHLLWQVELESPVIALYSVDVSSSTLISVPLTVVAAETLNRFKAPAAGGARDNSKLLQTLYVGECPYGLYALPSLVDETVYRIASSNPEGPYLIEGPRNPEKDRIEREVNDTEAESGEILLLGFYDVPESAPSGPPRQIEGNTGSPVAANEASSSTSPDYDPQNGTGAENVIIAVKPAQIITDGKDSHSTPHVFPPLPRGQYERLNSVRMRDNPSLVVLTTVIATVLVISIGYCAFRYMQRSHRRPIQKFTSGSNGIVTVGKISFDPSTVLGKGCEGTFVYKGKFENRSVAVKRVLPECFEFADREVDLLKESDKHPNVVRYFCTEEDMQFRYIALELCAATLHDWVEGKFVHDKVNPEMLLLEATDGLAYLHSLRIVHRDIKPANVLLSVCPTMSTVKAMISDFGLCKKLANGRVSFSRRSGGIPGTEGWIAPELMREGSDGQRTTHAVDIFSLGCVFYYVLSKGSHPFGDAFTRQSNIISGRYDLGKLTDDDDMVGIKELVSAMISTDAQLRPPPSAVLLHPLFWSKEKILGFFLDVSDRIEKENENACAILQSLENGAEKDSMLREDWRNHICPEVALDLRRYRTYKGNSVRDLLRALRNKKNHYRELTPQAQSSLGEIPDEFVHYWISRFPRLLPYTWAKFERVKSEPIFSKYYSNAFNFNENGCIPEIVEPVADIAEDAENFQPTNSNSDNLNASPQGSPKLNAPRQVITKNFWRSKNQNNRFRQRRVGGVSGSGKSPDRSSFSPAATSDNWRDPTN